MASGDHDSQLTLGRTEAEGARHELDINAGPALRVDDQYDRSDLPPAQIPLAIGDGIDVDDQPRST